MFIYVHFQKESKWSKFVGKLVYNKNLLLFTMLFTPCGLRRESKWSEKMGKWEKGI